MSSESTVSQREDLPQTRALAEDQLRKTVASINELGGTALLVPFRVFDAGPLHTVSAGLDFRFNGKAILPHPKVTTWIVNEARFLIKRENWKDPLESYGP